ncbi:MAG: Rab family GTPase [Promethearchaeota archaeon]
MKKTIKVIVSGDGGVGKTSFLNRLIHNNFDPNSELTKGVDFFSKDVSINGYEYNFVMWDFAGQDQFKKLLSDFVNGSLAAFILFDLSRFNTLEGVEEWITTLNHFGNIPAYIIGTKSDIINMNEAHIFDDYISEIIRNNKNIIGYSKISSKTGFNVKQAFSNLINSLSN